MLLKIIRKKSKLFSILFSLLLLLQPSERIRACVYVPDPEELRFMWHSPDLIDNKSWWSFFYTVKLDYMQGTIKGEDDEWKICKEWMLEANATVDLGAVRQCLFGNLPDSLLVGNAFYKVIRKNPDMFKYFRLSRQNQVVNDEQFMFEEPEKDQPQEFWIEDVKQLYEKASSDFYRKRYAYQILVMTYYATDFQTFRNYYRKHFNLRQNKSPLDWWAHHYKSMVLESEGKKDSANFLHALVFSNSSSKMLVSKRMFSVKNFSNVLKLAKDKSDLADLYALKEIINPGRSMQGIQKVYKLSASHPILPLLISREVNKIEDWLGTPRYNGSPPTTLYWKIVFGDLNYQLLENWNRDVTYAKNMALQFEKFDQFRNEYPEFYHLSLASLYLITENRSMANLHLASVKPDKGEVQFQLRLLQTVALAYDDIKSEDLQEKIGVNIVNLFKTRFSSFESQKRLLSLCNFLKYRFEQEGMKHLAGLFYNYASNKFCFTCHWNSFDYSQIKYYNEHATVDELVKLLEVYNKKDKNSLEAVLLKPYPHPYHFYDMLAVLHLRNGNVKEALSAIEHTTDDFWLHHPIAAFSMDADPFNQNIELMMPQTMNRFSKMEILAKMVELEKEATEIPEKRVLNYMLLGNAWYNFTDNSDYMISYGNGYSDPTFDSNCKISLKKAVEYYNKSLALCNDNETRAKLLYMQSVCYRNMNNDNLYKQQARAYKQYSDSEFYKKRNCMTIDDMKF